MLFFLLQNAPANAAKPARRKEFGRRFAADFLQMQQTFAGTGKIRPVASRRRNRCSGRALPPVTKDQSANNR
ncbi:MAG: hypothetical protein AB7T18_14105 [Alphaproteobacteria bacterium]